MTEYRCRVCDAVLSENAKFCPDCGRQLDDGGPAGLKSGEDAARSRDGQSVNTSLSPSRKSLVGVSLVIALLAAAFSVAAVANAGALGDNVIVMAQEDAFVIFFASITAAVLSLVSIIAILSAPKDGQ